MPGAILPSEMVRSAFLMFAAHGVSVAFLAPLHRHYVRRSTGGAERLPPGAVRTAPRSMQIYDVVSAAFAKNSPRHAARKNQTLNALGARRLLKNVLEKPAVNLVSKLSQFPRVIENDAGGAGFLLAGHARRDKHPHRRGASRRVSQRGFQIKSVTIRAANFFRDEACPE